MGKVCYNEHPRGSGVAVLDANFGAPRSEMWLAKVARQGEISNAISKNFVGYCVGCEDLCGAWSFGFL